MVMFTRTLLKLWLSYVCCCVCASILVTGKLPTCIHKLVQGAYHFTGEISFWYSKYSRPWNIRFLQKLLKSSDVVVVSMYATFRKNMKNYNRGPTNLNKSHLVMIKTPTNHSSSRRDIVFRYVENHVGIVRRFLISKKGWVFKSH